MYQSGIIQVEQLNKIIKDCIKVAKRGRIWNQYLWQTCYWANLLGAPVAYCGDQRRCSVLGETPATATVSTKNPTCTQFRAQHTDVTINIVRQWWCHRALITSIDATYYNYLRTLHFRSVRHIWRAGALRAWHLHVTAVLWPVGWTVHGLLLRVPHVGTRGVLLL